MDVLSIRDLTATKKASGRPQDLADLEGLRKLGLAGDER